MRVVYLLIPTSNHNSCNLVAVKGNVVYLLIPTSNHNLVFCNTICIELYIFWFLHQTTTASRAIIRIFSCISFDSYIKPQPRPRMWYKKHVVYLLIPTSNHNLSMVKLTNSLLYIFWFLHQTTTLTAVLSVISELYIFWFLHQTTTIPFLLQ